MTDAELQTILAARAALDALIVRASRGAHVEECISKWPAFPDDPDLIAPCEAAARAGVDSSSIRRWCEKHEIGKRYGGRWYVSIGRLKAYLGN